MCIRLQRAYASTRSSFRLIAGLVACLTVLAPELVAQTAHFVGSTRILGNVGSGFSLPYGVAVDASGNVFVSDSGNNAVKEITAASGYATVITLAPAGGVSIPLGLAVDASGNVFFADDDPTGSPPIAVKEITAASGYTTVNTLSRALGDVQGVAVDGSDNLFVVDPYSGEAAEIVAAGGYTTVNILELPAGDSLNVPSSVAVDSNLNVWVADVGHGRVVEWKAASGYADIRYFTFSGPGSPIGVQGVAVDGSGNLFITDALSVKELPAAGGYATISTLADGIRAAEGVAVDGSGDVFVADTYNNVVKEIRTVQWVVLDPVRVGDALWFEPTFYFTFDKGGTIGKPAVLTKGVANLDFTDAGTGTCTTNGPNYAYKAGDTCSVDVQFAPTATGTRYGTVQLLDNSGNVLATASVQGSGVAK